MNTARDREQLVCGLSALIDLCDRISRESYHTQKVVWHDQRLLVTWGLDFDLERTESFVPSVSVLPETAEDKTSLGLRELAGKIETELTKIKQDEKWPAELPAEWFR